MKKFLAIIVTLCLLFCTIPGGFSTTALADEGTHTIVLSADKTSGGYSHSAALDGNTVEEFDYTWHADPGEAHNQVKNAPAEYYTGTKPDTDAAAYIAHDIFYYPELPVSSFQRVQYDGDPEWAYYYTAEEYADYIFATLPVSGSEVPERMMHSPEEAYENAVLHITQAGTYVLEGEWHGQIWIDLGDTDDTFTDESAKVTVILNGVDVTCTVAPALVFYSVYECDNTWEDQFSWSHIVDTADAGANVIIADGTVNNFTGENVYRMLKTTYKDGQEGKSVPVQKKMRKLDGAFYSCVSMNVDGEENDTGVLKITAGYEGLDTELHLTVNGGNIQIFSQDDGINVNEDGVSVVTFNGGSTHILAGLGSEGDGIDSNGFLVVNDGTVIALAKPNSDSGMDSDSGTYINGGTVVALGSSMDYARADNSTDAGQAVMNLQFAASQNADEAIIVTDTGGKVVFAYDPDQDEVAGDNARWYRGAIVSAPGIQVGGEYYVYVGGNVSGTETEGVYHVATVSGFSSDAKQQVYGSTGNLGGFGGRGGKDGEPLRGNGGMGGVRPERPEDWPPQNGGFDGGTPPGLSNGQQPHGGFGVEGPGRDTASEAGEVVFTMVYKVNSFSGVSDGMTRAMVWKVLGQMAGADVDDSREEPWYAKARTWASETGISDGTNPDGNITCEEFLTMLWRGAGSPVVSYDLSAFTDSSSVSSWAENAVMWAVTNGLLGKDNSALLRPAASLTAHGVDAIIVRLPENTGKYNDTNI